MESSGKRKRADEAETERKTSAEHCDGDKTVTDDEVEEFFAILRRMRVAAKHLKGRSGDAAAMRWTPAFKAADFGEVDGGDAAEEKVEVAENSGLDLNSVPPACEDENDDLVL